MTGLEPLVEPKPEGRPLDGAVGRIRVKIPYRVACQIAAVRLTENGGLEGQSVRTGQWGDIIALGAERFG
ncbi:MULTISPECIES: hypothetical protein [Hyphobacterium]|uniref:MOSC domain-containing protein n=1 Tax=Hyphobacterium vulgare TaxID=1736751 RepID=A0ABV6ZUE9_9PROT